MVTAKSIQPSGGLARIAVAPSAEPDLPLADNWAGYARIAFQRALSFLQGDLSLLTRDQLNILKRRLVYALATRAGYWLATLLLANILTLAFAERNPTPPHGFSFIIWTLGVWLIGVIPYILLRALSRRLADDTLLFKTNILHLSLHIWISVLYIWWLLGPLVLFVYKFVPGQPPAHFIFSAQTFVIATIAGQVIPIILFSPSVLARLSILVISVAALSAFWHMELFSNIIFVRWNEVQLCVYFILSWITGRDERRFHARALIAEQAALIAEEARERVNTFLGTLSHDMRSPLSAMGLTLSLVKENNTDPKMNRYLESMRSQAIALETMMNGTLDLSRLVSGTWDVKISDVSLPELVGKITGDIPDTARAAGVEFNCEVGPYIVSTDPTALARILRNLISNALRYTPATTANGSGQVSLDCTLNEEEKLVRISVVDNGLGIPADKLSDIFNEFVQLSNPERNREKGFGLGLFIVKGLADLLRHPCGVESQVGKGSRFWIDVPFRSRLPEALPDERWFTANRETLSGMTIVLVEDDRSQREPMCEVLYSWGCNVVAGDTAEAIIAQLDRQLDRSLAGRVVPDFILADYRLLEGETGTAAVAAIRKSLKTDVPAAIWTAETRPETLTEIATGRFEYLSKPIILKDLWELLTKYSRRSVGVSAHNND